jgi:hypothetical protein
VNGDCLSNKKTEGKPSRLEDRGIVEHVGGSLAPAKTEENNNNGSRWS